MNDPIRKQIRKEIENISEVRELLEELVDLDMSEFTVTDFENWATRLQEASEKMCDTGKLIDELYEVEQDKLDRGVINQECEVEALSNACNCDITGSSDSVSDWIDVLAECEGYLEEAIG